ncbi:hypothetical protein MRX96_006070 [Rhipicephalus microplus]
MPLLRKNKRNRFPATVEQPASGPVTNRIGKMAVPTEPGTFAVTSSYMNVAYNKRWMDVEVMFDMPTNNLGVTFA